VIKIVFFDKIKKVARNWFAWTSYGGRPRTSRSCDNISAVKEPTHFHKVA